MKIPQSRHSGIGYSSERLVEQVLRILPKDIVDRLDTGKLMQRVDHFCAAQIGEYTATDAIIEMLHRATLFFDSVVTVRLAAKLCKKGEPTIDNVNRIAHRFKLDKQTSRLIWDLVFEITS
jgi:hypothetical protein